MKYVNTNIEKQKSDIKLLEEIAKGKRLPDDFLDSKLEQDYTLGDFLAETIGMVNNPSFFLEMQEQEITNDIKIANSEKKDSPLYASLMYRMAGKISLAISGRFKDKTRSNLIKGCFSSANKCDERIVKNLAEKGNYKRSEKYEASSIGYKILSDKTRIIQELLFDYFKKERKIDNLMKSVDKNEISFPILMYHPLDWIDIVNKYAEKEKDINSNEIQQGILTEYVLCGINHLDKYKEQGLNFDSKKVQQTIREINANSNFLELNLKKINPVIKNIFPEYKLPYNN